MKKIIIILVGLIALATAQHVLAVAPTSTPTPTSSAASPTSQAGFVQQINELKDRIASRVAQLKLVGKKGVIGTVNDVAETQLSITDIHGNTVFVDVDELTKFSSPSAKASFGISDITKGSTVGILGLYNKESRRILARFVDVISNPTIFHGAVTSVDKDNYQLTIATVTQKNISIDVENLTRTYTYAKDTGIVKSGFSKIKQGERVVIVGYPDVNTPNKYIASRIILLPDLSINPHIVLLKPEELGVTPSTGSGTKLVPIIKNK